MEPNQQTNMSEPAHNSCGTCGACMHCGEKHDMRRYLIRHFMVLILGTILAFFVGMKLGEIKGWAYSGNAGMMRGAWGMHERW